MDATFTSACAKCGKVIPVEDMQYLPEVNAYKRAVISALKDGKPAPEAPDEEALKQKYGFGIETLFCASCLENM